MIIAIVYLVMFLIVLVMGIVHGEKSAKLSEEVVALTAVLLALIWPLTLIWLSTTMIVARLRKRRSAS